MRICLATALLVLSIGVPAAHSQETAAPKLAPPPPVAAKPAQRVAWLSAHIDALIAARAHLIGSRIGIAVADLRSGAVLYSRDPDGTYNIASNAKIITAAAALHSLGPSYSYRTDILAGAVTARGAIDGELYLRSSGDPSLDTAALARIAHQVRAYGVTGVRGGVTIDTSLFDGDDTPPHFNAQPAEQAAFRAPIGAASINFNSVAISIAPARSGTGAAVVTVDPRCEYVTTTGTIRTIERGRSRLRIDTKVHSDHIELLISGHIRADSAVQRVRRRIEHPAPYLGSVLYQQLREAGIKLDRKLVRIGPVEASAVLLVRHESAPLNALVHDLGKHSNNYVAEMILKTMGAHSLASAATPRPATWADGIAVVTSYLTERAGLAPASYRYENGSGLFDASAFSPAQVVRVLTTAGADFRVGPDLIASLATAGSDGTLRMRMLDGPASLRVRAKTGTLATASALAGYAGTATTNTLAFAVILNELPDSGPSKWPAKIEARSLQDEVAAALIAYLGGS